MSADTGPNEVDSSAQKSAAPTSAERAALQADLEERLAAARVERAKVLAAKGKAPTKRAPPKKPDFLHDAEASESFVFAYEAPRAAEPEPRAGPEPAQTTLKPSGEPPVQEPARATRELRREPPLSAPPRAPAAPLDEPPVPVQAIEVQSRRGLYIPQSALVAFACFFGLGFGVMLSLGAVVGLGWVSVADMRTPKLSEPAPAVPDAAPAAFKSDLPAPTPADQPGAAISPAPTRPDLQAQPALTGPRAQDDPIAALTGPGPRVVAAIPAIGWATTGEVSPVEIAVAFRLPVREPLERLPEPEARAGHAALPALFERGPVTASALPPGFKSPVADPVAVALPADASSEPKLRLFQTLFEIEADPRPLVLQQAMPKPELEILTPVSLPPAAVGLASLEPRFEVDVLPRIAPPAAKVAPPRRGHEMPSIGGPVVRPTTLAAKLRQAGEDVTRVALFTYAPASLSAEDIDKQLFDLEATGFPLARTSRVNFRVSQTHIRYYTAADETVARAIAAEVGGAARDFTRERISSPSGRIEIWMAGSRVGAAPASRPRATNPQRRAVSQAQQQERARAALKGRLVDSLKRRDYLR